MLTESGIVRSDIRSSFGPSASTADGVPLRITLTVQDSSAGRAAPAGAAVYLWHCNIDGKYSMYDDEIVEDNYLRGVQETDADGPGQLHHDLPRRLLRPLAARALRGVRQPVRRDRG